MHIHALSGDAEFLRILASSSFSGKVHSIFERTINLQCDQNNELYTIACDQLDNGPNTLVLDVKRFHETGLEVGDRVLSQGQTLQIGNKIEIAATQAKEWECTLPPYPSNIETLKVDIAFMKEYIAAHGKCGGMKRNSRPSTPFEAEMSNMLLQRSGLLREALAAGKSEVAVQHALGLVGLGPGLTPSGDDFLVGLFSIANMQGTPYYLSCHFLEEIALKAKQLTNEISYMMVKKAASGQVRESVVSLLQALSKGTVEELLGALEKVLAIGSSSGTDMALGLVCGLELNIEAGGRACLLKS
ncbi:DUF2877 domain-containing protein [Brevibacillus reuszeri]|uniref:DUF2877 domain-containing protein n=1 Tax=Brevibacillus reuszeri TaxID=54915 RepID=UPI000CCC91D6|nr:DUF2877 domain-containing protein [Brevibacillus reuszeri]